MAPGCSEAIIDIAIDHLPCHQVLGLFKRANLSQKVLAVLFEDTFVTRLLDFF